MHRYRSHTCGALRDSDIGSTVRLSGWCHRIRDHGGVLFIDLRDHYGLTQVVADPDSKAFKLAETLRSEWVIGSTARCAGSPGAPTFDLPTGQVEVYIDEIEVLGPAAELPMPVFGEQEYPEEIRLKYRFLDLRREHLHANIMLRGKIIDLIGGGWRIWILRISDAHSHRLVAGRRARLSRALAPAPRKILRIAAGAAAIQAADHGRRVRPLLSDRTMFPRRRRARDRSPGEFYQLDLEMSFVTQQDVFDAVEPVIRGVFEEFANGKPVTPNFRSFLMPKPCANRRDKPDLRNPIVMQDVSEAFRGSGFKIFATFSTRCVGAGVGHSRAQRRQPRILRSHECLGPGRRPAWSRLYLLARGRGGRRRPLAKNIGTERTKKIADQLKLGVGDAVFFVAGKPKDFVKFAGPARVKSAKSLA